MKNSLAQNNMLKKNKFCSLTLKRKHKHAALILIQIFEGDISSIPLYQEIENLLSLEALLYEKKAILERIFFHQDEAEISFANQYNITTKDSETSQKKLSVDIYLENLRSMHNIGAIIRSCEAFALGTIYLSKQLPDSAIEKIAKTAMGAEKNVTIKIARSLDDLQRPLIALETAVNAKDCNAFAFPKKGTILFGNEKYGLSDDTLEKSDEIVQIPLYGKKNSVNVSNAFAIIANCIRSS